jgi:undecaprenyl-diphosphatase
MAERLPSAIQDTFNTITDFGRSGWVLWPTGILLLVTAAAMTRAATRMAQSVLATIAVRFGYVFLAVGIPGLFVTIVKRWIGRVRPSHDGPFAYHPFSWNPAYASLPSGHSAAAFSALIAIGAIFPRARPVLWIYAVTIAMSRVIISAHYPSDVIAGAVVGASGAIFVREWFAARQLGFTVGANGQVRALPGPSLKRIKKVARIIAAQ